MFILKKNLPYIVVLLLTIIMFCFPQRSIALAKNAIMLCFDILIPSLFPFFVCSGLLIYSGFAQSISTLFRPVMKPLFNINASGAAAFVLGIVSGYPLGAITACQLYTSGYLSKSETERLLAFCNNSGPLFILGAVGTAMYSSVKIGVMLYIAHIAAAVTVGIIFRFYEQQKFTAPSCPISQESLPFSQVFSKVLASSINSILTVCGSVIFFSVLSGIISDFIPEGSIARPIFLGIAELTGGIKSISTAHISLFSKLILSAGVAGFAGLCVHLQVMSLVSAQALSLKPYIIGKLLHGSFAALYTLLLLKIFPQTEAVFKTCSAKIDAAFCISSVYQAAGIIFILALCILIAIFGFETKKRITKEPLH